MLRSMFTALTRVTAITTVVGILALPVQAENLQQIYNLAKENDALLKAQAAQAAAGRETANIYRSALLPHASLDSGTSRSDMDYSGSLCKQTGKCGDRETDYDSNAVHVSQNILNMEAWYDFQKGKKIGEQATAQYTSDELELLVRVTEAYINVLRAIDAYQTALAQEQAIARQLEQTQQRFDVGLIPITDVHESQATFDAAHVDTLNTQGSIGIAFEAIQVLTGQPLEMIAPLSDELPIQMPEPATQAEWEALTLANNPDLAVSALAVDAARNNAKARKSAHLPTVNGTLQYNDNDSDTDFNPGHVTDGQEGSVASINLSVPLFSGGGISAQRRQAYQQQMSAEDTHTNNTRNAVQRARSYHLAVSTDVQRVAAQKQAIVSSQSALDATQAGYEVGTRNIVDVLDAEQRLYSAKFGYANARYRFILDMLRLLQTAGTLSVDNLDRLNNYLLPEQSLSRSAYVAPL